MSLLGDALGLGGGLIGIGETSWDRDQERNLLDTLGASGLDPNSIHDLGQSAFTKLSTDPATRNAQMEALSRLGDIGKSGGLDAQSQAAISQEKARTFADEKAQRGALEQSLASRGLGGSGAETAGLLAGEQGGANREAMANEQATADARTRAMAALGQYGNMAGNIRGEDYRQAADKASAMDAVNKFNAEQSGNRFNAAAKQQELLEKEFGIKSGYYDKDAAQKMAMYTGAAGSIGNIAGDFAGLGAGVPAVGSVGNSSMYGSTGGATQAPQMMSMSTPPGGQGYMDALKKAGSYDYSNLFDSGYA